MASGSGALATTHEVLTLNQVVWMVSASPNAIGVATVEAADDSVVPLHSDLVFDQSMYLVTRDRAEEATQDVFEAAAAFFGSAAGDTSVAVVGTR